MNHFTQLSIELANQRNYLDLLFGVYPLAPDTIRTIDNEIWKDVEAAYASDDNAALMRALVRLDLFPVKDGYVPYLKRDGSAIDRNPATVNRICGRIRVFGIHRLYEECTRPKETNRQMGPLFRRWLESGALGVRPVDEETFANTDGDAILGGSDSTLKHFANSRLGYKRNKGLDFVGRFGGTYVIGEAKFIADEGGHQNDQFEDALLTINSAANKNVVKIGILDGVLYIPGNKKMYKTITESDVPIMSALVLREFLYSLYGKQTDFRR